jgi:hypothetical protein
MIVWTRPNRRRNWRLAHQLSSLKYGDFFIRMESAPASNLLPRGTHDVFRCESEVALYYFNRRG